jgi:hypothetical protein
MVEGQARSRLREYPAERRIGIIENCSGRDSKGLDACCFEPCVTRGVSLRPIASAVGLAIDFDRQASITAKEVENVWAGRMLTPELHSARLLAKRLPQDDLWQAHFTAKSTGTFDSA